MIFRTRWDYRRRVFYPFTVTDTTAPFYDVQPVILVNPGETVNATSTGNDAASSEYDKAYVILASGDSAPANGQDIFDLTNNAASPLFSGNQQTITSGSETTFSNIGPLSSGAFVYYEAIRDDVDNYTLADPVAFSISASQYVHVPPMRVIRHTHRYV